MEECLRCYCTNFHLAISFHVQIGRTHTRILPFTMGSLAVDFCHLCVCAVVAVFCVVCFHVLQCLARVGLDIFCVMSFGLLICRLGYELAFSKHYNASPRLVSRFIVCTVKKFVV